MANEGLKIIIGDNVRRLRCAAGLTQAHLAELVERDPSTITNIESGKRLIGVELLVKLAGVFSVSVDTLLHPEGTAPHYISIASMLNNQSNGALAHLEPIIRAWLSEYGDPKPPARKSK